MPALNYKGQESQQSKERRQRKADRLAGKGSTADILKAQREAKAKRMKRLKQNMNMGQYFNSK